MVGQWAAVFCVPSKYTTSRCYSCPATGCGYCLKSRHSTESDKFHSQLSWRFCVCVCVCVCVRVCDHLPELSPPQRRGTNRIKPGRASRAAAQSSSSQRRGEGAQRDTFLLMNVAQFSGRQDALCCKTSLPLPFPSCSQHEHSPPQTLHCGTAFLFFLSFFLFFFFFSFPFQLELSFFGPVFYKHPLMFGNGFF